MSDEALDNSYLSGAMLLRAIEKRFTAYEAEYPLLAEVLVETARRANDQVAQFKLDTLWDMASHPQGWYFRSDHLPYARVGIPALSFSSNLHPDYHTPRDEPSTIDYRKLTRVAKWMYATGWAVANADQRPAVDPGFKLER